MTRRKDIDESPNAVPGVDINDLPSLSIRRPVLVLVLNLLILLAGIAAILAVETRELPDVDRPIVSVRAEYPGASPETMDAEVISVIEGAVARVSGIQNIRSSSEENAGRMRIEFRPDVNLDSAASDVREAVNRIARELPDRLEQVIVVKADNDSEAIVNIAVRSDVLIEEELTRIVEKDIIPELISIDGVADVRPFGNRKRMLRVVVDPLRLTSYGLSVTDVATTLRLVPFDVPAGSFRSEDQELIVRADASVVSAAQIADIIIRDSIRIGDIANVYFGPEDAEAYTRLNGQSVIGLGVIRQAKANTVRISDGVHAVVDRINARVNNLELTITDDQAIFVRSSITEVLITLSITIAIVIATIWLFMGSLRATLVPSIAIPVALIGTVAAIWLAGFSINILTLLALVLATGLVVDDAIVVLENIQRRRAQGLGARAAAVLGTRQVFFAVVTTTAVLISVFVPIAFLPSTAGRLFREFGVVLAIAVAISSFVSLSLVPAAASRLPAAGDGSRFNRAAAKFGNSLRNFYASSLSKMLDRPWIPLLVALVFAAGAALLYQQLDRVLIPPEDRGVVNVDAAGPDGTGIGYMNRQTQKIEDILQPLVDSGEASSLFTIVGTWDPNRSRVTVPLVDWDDRQRSQQEIAASLEEPLSRIPGARVSVSGSNSLNLHRSGGELEVALVGNDYYTIFEAAKILAANIEDRLPDLSDPRISYDPTQPQLSVDIDRRRASDLGIDLDNLAATLRAMIDGDELVDLNVEDEAVPILLESSSGDINDPSDLVNLYVSTNSGQLVPLSSVVTLSEQGVATQLDRHAQRRAIEVSIQLPPNFPLQTAVDDLRALADEVLPSNVSMILLGEAATLEETSREVAFTYAIALAVIFLVLAAQFEGFTSAVVVTLIVPFGVAAAIYALFLTGTSINIYSQIGLVLLIGLMAKNSVLLVEFADQLRDRGYGIREAIETGATVRLRPVAMTMISTILGGLPLILSDGAGAEARSSIGWVVFGGLGIAALFTLYLTPMLYLMLARFSAARAEESSRLADELQQARGIADTASN
ncbi:MAG: efflux RND transporter permease subunit [Gammaproteobacteria bacterium]|nr:efflux RND transporter permease subunit [Gammaproteobacteria bacterium]MDH5241194.1 efflux RND transporter permease subunit [Gammaproteobacteria bacterium]MDH5262112.1 efflux RND transporter permease subunit [Gammaproteobacteria bacterium]MDH5582503.1 efflux RND transporter permease subunit [Gammaproteobacteria bacterium]